MVCCGLKGRRQFGRDQDLMKPMVFPQVVD
jgi:hypothetical protein